MKYLNYRTFFHAAVGTLFMGVIVDPNLIIDQFNALAALCGERLDSIATWAESSIEMPMAQAGPALLAKSASIVQESVNILQKADSRTVDALAAVHREQQSNPEKNLQIDKDIFNTIHSILQSMINKSNGIAAGIRSIDLSVAFQQVLLSIHRVASLASYSLGLLLTAEGILEDTLTLCFGTFIIKRVIAFGLVITLLALHRLLFLMFGLIRWILSIPWRLLHF